MISLSNLTGAELSTLVAKLPVDSVIAAEIVAEARHRLERDPAPDPTLVQFPDFSEPNNAPLPDAMSELMILATMHPELAAIPAPFEENFCRVLRHYARAALKMNGAGK